jgi:hypothetical protein
LPCGPPGRRFVRDIQGVPGAESGSRCQESIDATIHGNLDRHRLRRRRESDLIGGCQNDF